MFGFGEKEPPKKLKFKQGDMVKIIIGGVTAMVTGVHPNSDYSYSIEYWDYKTNTPERLRCKEFEIRKVKK